MSLEVTTTTTPEVTKNWFQDHVVNINTENNYEAIKLSNTKEVEIPIKHNIDHCDRNSKKGQLNTRISQKELTEPVICGVENCGKSYCNKYVLKEHIAKVHKATKEITKKRSDVEKNHKCDEPGCKAAFNRPYRLKNHKLSVHQGQKPFKCDFEDCDKSYSNDSHLARHKSKCHLLETESNFEGIICKYEGCGLVFANKHSLKKHLFTSHTNLPFSCKDCDETFKRKSHLHAHKVETHNDDAPYKCVQCSRTFIHFHLYNKHVKNHKTYKCDCDMTFDRWSKLLKHRKSDCTIKTKKNCKCVICDKVFSQSYHLTMHSQTVHVPDSQATLFKCPYLNCGKSYKYQKNLKHHTTYYHEECFRRVKCTEENCDVVLKSNKNLKQHIRIVHSGLRPKIRKPRRPRKDKGLHKKSMASVISGFDVPAEENRKNMSEENKEKELNNITKIANDCKNPIEIKENVVNEYIKPLANENSEVSREETKNNGISNPTRQKKNNVTENEDEASFTVGTFKKLPSMSDFENDCSSNNLDNKIVVFDFPEFNDSIKEYSIETIICTGT